MPENSNRPRKRATRVSASAASVPRIVATDAERNATRNETDAASSIASSLESARYQRSDHPPHTVTRRESLNELITRMAIGR